MSTPQIVKYSKPQEGEADFRFVLLEDNGDRVLIQLLNSGMPFPPIETVDKSEVECVS